MEGGEQLVRQQRTGPGDASGPLAGVRVLDLTRLLPGGYATLLLADLGAVVVKVEEPGRGDYLRWIPPLVDGQSAGHRALNRGKRSVCLDLKHPPGSRPPAPPGPAGGRAGRELPAGRDSTGWASGMSDAVRANPRLVICAITGYGQDGPYRDRVGHDINYLGFGGALSMTGRGAGRRSAAGRPGG